MPPEDRAYIVSYLGGTQYWWLPGTHGGGLHQVGSAGFCWTCLQPDYSLDQEQRGLVRHPVTPEEQRERSFRCFVCGAGMNKGAEEPHKDVDHTVIWGEETHPRCADCGKGYQVATPEGIDYVPHHRNCPAINAHPDVTEEEIRAWVMAHPCPEGEKGRPAWLDSYLAWRKYPRPCPDCGKGCWTEGTEYSPHDSACPAGVS